MSEHLLKLGEATAAGPDKKLLMLLMQLSVTARLASNSGLDFFFSRTFLPTTSL